jgi:hypothetical protein
MTKAEQTRLTAWRLKILRSAGEEPRQVARTCRYFGISRTAFYKWKHRFDELGEAGLADRARTPHRSPRATRYVTVKTINQLYSVYGAAPQTAPRPRFSEGRVCRVAATPMVAETSQRGASEYAAWPRECRRLWPDSTNVLVEWRRVQLYLRKPCPYHLQNQVPNYERASKAIVFTILQEAGRSRVSS